MVFRLRLGRWRTALSGLAHLGSSRGASSRRLKASTDGPPAATFIGSRARSQAAKRTLWNLLAFTAPLPVPMDRSSLHGRSRLVTNPRAYARAQRPGLTGKGSSRPSIPGPAQRLPDRDEPDSASCMYRAIQSGGTKFTSGTVDLSRPRWRPVCGAGHVGPVLFKAPRTPIAVLRRHVEPYRKLDLASGACPSAHTPTRADTRRVRPQSPCTARRQTAPTAVNAGHADSRQVSRCRPEPIECTSTQPRSQTVVTRG